MDHNSIEQWVAFYESSGLTQEEFERVHGVPARTLRSWRRKSRASRQPPAEAVREAVEQAVAALLAVRDRLAAACRTAPAAEAEQADSPCTLAQVPGPSASSEVMPRALPLESRPSAVVACTRVGKPSLVQAEPAEVAASTVTSGARGAAVRPRRFFEDPALP